MILQCVSSCQRVQTIGSWTSPVMLATPLYLLQKRYLTPTLSRQTCHPVGFISDHARAEGVSNVTAQPADAQDLEQFHDCTFAAVTCSYGLMLMPDHARALREAYRVLQPGGIYVATVWAPLETFQFGQVSITQLHVHHKVPLQHIVQHSCTYLCKTKQKRLLSHRYACVPAADVCGSSKGASWGYPPPFFPLHPLAIWQPLAAAARSESSKLQ